MMMRHRRPFQTEAHCLPKRQVTSLYFETSMADCHDGLRPPPLPGPLETQTDHTKGKLSTHTAGP